MLEKIVPELKFNFPKISIRHRCDKIEIIFAPVSDFRIALVAIQYSQSKQECDEVIRFTRAETRPEYLRVHQDDIDDFNRLPKQTRSFIVREIKKHRTDLI